MIVNKLKLDSPDFPAPLTTISSPPAQLYYSGVHPNQWLQSPKVAIVGSRKITPYGRTVTARLSSELARAGVIIISGLAYGVDIAAHRSALESGGITVAVLPSGLDQIYPAAHSATAKQIIERGTLITEYTAGSAGFKSNFIARNRIVSGLCDILLITEAAVNSGSLHTARFALEQGKSVMAVPGNITSPISEGCNNLIKSGAIPVTSADDVFFALGLNPSLARQKNFSGSLDEQLVLDFIKQGVGRQEELAAAAKIDSPALASALTMLEIEGYIRPTGGGNWAPA